jgi:TRAP-type mannitol/chloroaromatic compound transport system permease small subunit
MNILLRTLYFLLPLLGFVLIVSYFIINQYSTTRKSTVASTLLQYISQQENTKCEFAGYSIDEKANI